MSESLHFLNMISSSPMMELHLAHIKQQQTLKEKVHIVNGDHFLRHTTLNPFGRSALQKTSAKRSDYVFNESFKKGKTFKVEIESYKKIFLMDLDYSISLIRKEVGNETLSTILDDLETAVLSGIANYTRVPSFDDLNHKWKSAFFKIKTTSIFLFLFFSNYLEKSNISETFTFNGRFSCSKALVWASKIRGVNYNVYDLNRGFNHYCFRNSSLHSITNNTARAIKLYQENVDHAELTAKRFYENKRNRKFTYQKSHTTSQKKGFIGRKTNKKIIAIFTSSDDEFRFNGSDWGDNQKTVDQISEISSLIKYLGNEYAVYIRMHPNQHSIPKNILNKYKRSFQKKAYLILPKSNVDTYHLIDSAHVVITFCSLVGPETSYFGKNLITIGPSPYMNLNIGRNVASAYEASRLIKEDLYNYEKKGAIIWANYLMNYSDSLPSFKNLGNGIFTIDGERIKLKNKFSFLLLIAKFEIFISRNNFFDIRSIKIAIANLMTLIDGRLRGDHDIK